MNKTEEHVCLAFKGDFVTIIDHNIRVNNTRFFTIQTKLFIQIWLNVWYFMAN